MMGKEKEISNKEAAFADTGRPVAPPTAALSADVSLAAIAELTN